MAKKGTHFVAVEDAPTGRMSDRARELLALALCGFALYALLCLATFHMADLGGPVPTGNGRNLGGTFGYYIAGGFVYVLGFAGWVPFVALLGYSVAMFLHKPIERVLVKTLGALVFAAMLSLLLAGLGVDGHTAMSPQGAGGAFGANLSPKLQAVFGGPGRLLLVLFGALVSFLLVTEWLFSAALLRVARGCEAVWRRWRGLPAVVPAGGAAGLLDDDDEPRAPRKRKPAKPATAKGAGVDDADDAEDDTDDDDEKQPPKARVRKPARAADDDDENDAKDGADDDDADGDVKVARPRARKVPVDDDDEDGSDLDRDDDDEPSATAKGRAKAGDKSADKDKAVADKNGKDADAKDVVGKDAKSEPAVEAAKPVVVPPPIVVPMMKPKPKPAPKPKPKKPAQTDLPFDEAYPFPPVELFKESQQNDVGATQEQLQKGGEAIASKLSSFGIQAEIVAASVGPAVTQYELRLAEGIRVNKVVGFEADLAAALKAVAVRVVAPIPGKDTIGIEVPNGTRQKVFMRDLLDQFGRSEELAIPLFLGKDVAGNPIVEDLARMPHLLIAGTTGSGKSVCINTILLSILLTRTPQQVKLILVDPKMVELQAYKQVPHLCCDVVTNMKKAPSVLQWAVDEMENRYALLSAAGVNHIKNYNRLGQQELAKRLKREPEPERVQLPYIVIVIDEFADLMNVAQNEVEESIQRLAQKSRAVGMHVILATQRPSSEVITGIIKANLPCQIAFKVNRRIDSRVILDANGAEKLLGFGDMLYVPPGGGVMLRAQGTFVADDEMQAVVRFLEEHGQRPSFLPALVQTQTSQRSGMAERDALYREAVEVILGQQRGSATLLQRALSVGYTRATRLLEMMEEDGLVGAFVGSKSRDVLMTLDEWKAREAAMAAELAAIDGEGEGGEGGDGAAGDESSGEVAAGVGEPAAAGDDDAHDEAAHDDDAPPNAAESPSA